MLDSATDLRSILKDPSLLVEQAYIAGEWVNAADGKTFAVTNPARGDVIANVADMTRLGLPVPPGFTITTEGRRVLTTWVSAWKRTGRWMNRVIGDIDATR